MKKRTRALALCAVMAALAVTLLFLGGVVPLASIALPVLASMALIPVYAEYGAKWGFLWYLAVAGLGLLLTPDREAAILFVFFGYYPMLRRRFGHLRVRPVRLFTKLLYLNASVVAAYGLMIFVFRIGELSEDFASTEKWLLCAVLILANICFALYDLLLARLEVLYHARLRPRLKL